MSTYWDELDAGRRSGKVRTLVGEFIHDVIVEPSVWRGDGAKT